MGEPDLKGRGWELGTLTRAGEQVVDLAALFLATFQC